MKLSAPLFSLHLRFLLLFVVAARYASGTSCVYEIPPCEDGGTNQTTADFSECNSTLGYSACYTYAGNFICVILLSYAQFYQQTSLTMAESVLPQNQTQQLSLLELTILPASFAQIEYSLQLSPIQFVLGMSQAAIPLCSSLPEERQEKPMPCLWLMVKQGPSLQYLMVCG